MPTTYTVVQYVPDPIAEERLNVGVIAASGDHIRARFLSNWLRAERFGNSSVQNLREFARHVEYAAAEPGPELQLGGPSELNETRLRELAGRWVNSIQFTTPRVSLLEPDAVIDQLARRFLHETIQAPRE